MVLVIFTIGCIDHALLIKNNYELKYSFDEGDHLIYEVKNIPENENEVLKTILEMDIINIENDSFQMLIKSSNSSSGQIMEPPYTITMTSYGVLVKSDYIGPLLQEIQPEFPNGLKYPEKNISENRTWFEKIKKSGNYSSQGNVIEYSVIADCTYTGFDQKIVTVKAGKFSCVNVKQEVSFTLEEKLDTGNGTVYTTTYGKISGENWINQEKGFLVKSDHTLI